MTTSDRNQGVKSAFERREQARRRAYKRVKTLRKSLGMTQLEFARELGCSQQSVCMWERNERALRDQTLAQICVVFGVNEAWLRYGEGETFASQEAPARPVTSTTSPPAELADLLERLFRLLPAETRQLVREVASRDDVRHPASTTPTGDDVAEGRGRHVVK